MSGENDNEIEAEKVDGEEGDEGVPEMEEANGPPKHEPFAVKVFGIAKEQQNSNGLRHNDHLRYRQYCTRRLRRLRCTLRWKNPPKRGKQVLFPNDFTDQRFLEFPLVNAERAWSYAVQLKSDNAQASTWQPRWRLHSIRRFSKAVKWAEFLETACKRHGDERTQREAGAYSAFMAGTLMLEQEQWSEALEKFTRCRQVCEHLALASDQAEGIIFKEHSKELAPLIRECRYNLGMGQEEDDSEGAAKVKGAVNKDLAEFCYRGHGLTSPPEKIKVKLDKCLKMVKDIKGDSQEENAVVIEKYGELSAEFTDTLKDIHTEMISPADDGPSESEWCLLEAFARELSICQNVERNLVLLSNHLVKLDNLEELSSHKARNTCRPEEGMRYSDLLKEDIESLLELPETSESMTKTLGSYITVALNCRCFFLALCHSLTGKSLESAALLDMLRLRLEDNVLGAALEEPLGSFHSIFERIVQGMPNRISQWRCRGLAALCSKAPKLKDQETDGQDGPASVTFPPRAKDIPCKPFLFDLAFPCIEAPDFEELLPKSRPTQEPGPGIRASLKGVAGGIGSRLSGFWGGGKK